MAPSHHSTTKALEEDFRSTDKSAHLATAWTRLAFAVLLVLPTVKAP